MNSLLRPTKYTERNYHKNLKFSRVSKVSELKGRGHDFGRGILGLITAIKKRTKIYLRYLNFSFPKEGASPVYVYMLRDSIINLATSFEGTVFPDYKPYQQLIFYNELFFSVLEFSAGDTNDISMIRTWLGKTGRCMPLNANPNMRFMLNFGHCVLITKTIINCSLWFDHKHAANFKETYERFNWRSYFLLHEILISSMAECSCLSQFQVEHGIVIIRIYIEEGACLQIVFSYMTILMVNKLFEVTIEMGVHQDAYIYSSFGQHLISFGLLRCSPEEPILYVWRRGKFSYPRFHHTMPHCSDVYLKRSVEIGNQMKFANI